MSSTLFGQPVCNNDGMTVAPISSESRVDFQCGCGLAGSVPVATLANGLRIVPMLGFLHVRPTEA